MPNPDLAWRAMKGTGSSTYDEPQPSLARPDALNRSVAHSHRLSLCSTITRRHCKECLCLVPWPSTTSRTCLCCLRCLLPAWNLPKEIHSKDTTTSAAPPWTDIRDSAIIRARSRVPVRETPPSRRGFPNWNSASFVFDVLRQHTTLRSASARVCSFGGGCAAQLWALSFSRHSRARQLELGANRSGSIFRCSAFRQSKVVVSVRQSPVRSCQVQPNPFNRPPLQSLGCLVAWLLGRSLR